MASLANLPSPHLSPVRPPHFPRPVLPPSPPKFKGDSRSRLIVLRSVNRLPKANPEADSSSQDEGTTPPSPPSSSYRWCAALAGLGFLETSYLTYLKLSNSEAACPVGGGGACGDVLNSDYSVVYGFPLPLIGMVAYGVVLVLGLQLPEKTLPFGISKNVGRLMLLSTTASMAAASTYFLFLLSTKFAGASCLYCLASATLSFSLFFVSVKELGLHEIQKVLAIPLCTAAMVVAVLGTSYSSAQPVLPSSAEIDLPYYSSEITTESSPLALSLAKHLRSVGAKMYGAFWCSHCLEQKEIFGREAAELLDYVECFPDGYRKGVKIAKVCANAGIDGFPTWVIDGQVLSGDQELEELARVSGFKIDQFQ
ncbi:ribosome biosynthesis protein lto1 [Dionaea muscipula]